jgi:membrane-bound serine protease (ClpP class)
MLASKYGANGYTLTRLEVTWSERMASGLTAAAPILMGLGLLAIFIEFKTPGFGVFGITGGVLLALVFFGHYTAGLSGHLPALVFLLGVALVGLEIFLLPGTIVPGVMGVAMMLGALVWSMLDVWPDKMPRLDGDTLTMPLLNVALAVVVAVVTAVALGRFLPRGWFWDKMILETAMGGDAGVPASGMGGSVGVDSRGAEAADDLCGALGVAVSVLRPMGEVEVAGRRYEARADLGALERGDVVRVVGRSGRTLIVALEVK